MYYIVTGRVHPERADISFSRVEMGLQSGGTAIASCDSSQITVILNDASIDGWITAKVAADEIASLVVGALGFSLGSGYFVEMVQVTEHDGTAHVFGVRPQGYNNETLGFEPHIPPFNRALRLSVRDIFFRVAVRDYLRAIRETDDCATYCYRAIESIKSAFVFETGEDRWKDMHDTLGTDRETIVRVVKGKADPVRHGNWVNAPVTTRYERWEMLSLTRDILQKYLDYFEPEET